jgi:hypothetical protein
VPSNVLRRVLAGKRAAVEQAGHVQAGPERGGRRGGAGRHAQLGEDVLDVRGHRPLGDRERQRDGVVRPALDEQAENLEFPAGQAVQVAGRRHRHDRRVVLRRGRRGRYRRHPDMAVRISRGREWTQERGDGGAADQLLGRCSKNRGAGGQQGVPGSFAAFPGRVARPLSTTPENGPLGNG